MGWFSEIQQNVADAILRAGQTVACAGHHAAVDAARTRSVMTALHDGQDLSRDVARERFAALDRVAIEDDVTETIMLSIGAFASSLLSGASGRAAIGSLTFGAVAVVGAELGFPFADAVLTWLGLEMLSARAREGVARAFGDIADAMAEACNAPAEAAGRQRGEAEREAAEIGAARRLARALVDLEDILLVAMAAAISSRRGSELARALRQGRFGGSVATWVERNQAGLTGWAAGPRFGNARPAMITASSAL